ncbi:MAG: hypothetical protein JST35_12845 [Armatimonadetes bacterium]|nr:hypothetical protein [Armatimonadota bacterium]
MALLAQRLRRNLTLGLGLVALVSVAQAQDFPTHSGNNQRSGTNGDVLGAGPGQGLISWFFPNAAEPFPSGIFRNQTSTEAVAVPGGTWLNAGPLVATGGAAIIPINATPEQGPEPAGTAEYVYTGIVASTFRVDGVDYDPTVPLVPGTARYFQWTMTPPVADQFTPRTYALFVNVPQGPTDIAPSPVNNQRYQVYEVFYGNNRRWVEIVDTWQNGYVRLGAAGRNQPLVFQYSGNPAQAIRVRVYNTMARDGFNNLLNGDPNNPQVVPTDRVVYADAVFAKPSVGSYSAGATVRSNPNVLAALQPIRTVAAFNRVAATQDVDPRFTNEFITGEVSSYDYNTGNRRWKFSAANARNIAITEDNTDATASAGWTVTTTPDDKIGDNYLISTNPVIADPNTAESVNYVPALVPGDYNVEMFLPGPRENTAIQPFCTQQVVRIHEGASVFDFTVNVTTQSGWVTIGTRKYKHDPQNGNPLRVEILAASLDPQDIIDLKVAYADAVRFVRPVYAAVTATPVQATCKVRLSPAEIIPPERDIVLIPAEDGRLYCVDAQGNPDGTTNLYWTYPSLPDPANPTAVDPNLDVPANAPIANRLDGEDGVLLAQMPQGFGLSSPVIQRINGDDYVFIGSRNGRVYCIEMAGRGDQNFGTGKAGTTRRRWTFPQDYPQQRQSALGQIVGSVSFADVGGQPTLFVPDTNGRVWALDALGNNVQRTTTVRWAFPAINQPTLGPVTTTPMVAFNPQRVYFGTTPKDDTATGQLWCVDAANPLNLARQWFLNGTNFPGGPVNFEAFKGGFAAGTAAELGSPTDQLFVANTNGNVYAFQPDGTFVWQTDEVGAGIEAPLSLSRVSVPDQTGNLYDRTLLLLATKNGSYQGLFADPATLNLFGGRLAWGYQGDGIDQTAGLAVGRNWMYTGDSEGNFYAFDGTGNPQVGGIPPGGRISPPNEPPAPNVNFRNTIIKFITSDAARRLKLAPGDPQRLTYADVITGNTYDMTRNPAAFDWGETVHVLVGNFPYATQTPNGTVVAPPRVQYSFRVGGRTLRTLQANSRQFDTVSGSNPPAFRDGFAIFDYVVQGYGQDGIAVGDGRVTISIRTQALNDSGADSVVAIPPTQNNRTFAVANPIAISTQALAGGPITVANLDPARSFGLSTNPSDAENRVNGTPLVGAKNGALLATSAGSLNHGGSAVTPFYVVDRSLMSLLRGQGQGLYNVRALRGELEWQGAGATVFRPIGAAGFEDLPIRFPNNSLDYPNLSRDTTRVTKDPNGISENPIFSPVTLNAPLIPDTNNPQVRTMAVTPFEVGLSVPRYQPGPVGAPGFTEIGGSVLPGGFLGRFTIFVDTNSDGTLNSITGQPEAQRGFTFTAGVNPDRRLDNLTPTVDFGSLASGTGFTPGFPGTGASSFNPRNPAWSNMFRPVVLRNEGNVNLLNLRLAKGTAFAPGGAFNPWPIFGPAVDDLAYLNGASYLFSDLDAGSISNYTLADSGLTPAGSFSLLPNTFVQKPRITDRRGNQVVTNPIRRANPAIGITGRVGNNPDALIPTLDGTGNLLFQPNAPRIGMAVPFGFPSGSYQQAIRFIEDDLATNSAMDLNNLGDSLEPFSDPATTIKAKVRETRLTTSTTFQPRRSPSDPLLPMTGRMVDNFDPTSIYMYNNQQPSGYRLLNGTMLVTWTSNRPTDSAATPTNPSQRDDWRIYLATLGGTTPNAAGGFTPLRDLDAWVPGGTQFFQKSAQTAAGFPDLTGGANAVLYNVQPGETVIDETRQFGSPVFPLQGEAYSAASSTGPYMAFIGSVQKQAQSGRQIETRIYISRATVAPGGVTLSAPVPNNFDVQSGKGRLAMVQDGDIATVFYARNAAGGSRLYWTQFNGATWTEPKPVDTPDGFESVASPSMTLRRYFGTGTIAGAQNSGYLDLMDVVFTGRLTGRAVAETYLMRLGTGGANVSSPVETVWLNQIIQEPLADGGERGVFRSQGLRWNRSASLNTGFNTANHLVLEQFVGGAVQNLEVPGTRVNERGTGIVSFDCVLGGKVYIDPSQGSVRFSTARPARNSSILLSYQPSVIRISDSDAAAYSASTVLFDNRLTSITPNSLDLAGGKTNQDYWFRPSGAFAVVGDPIRNDRFHFFYTRSASGNGQSARPYVKTARFGVQLPSAIFTNASGALLTPGNVSTLTVAGTPANDFYQVDPARGRIYFTRGAEDSIVTVTYRGQTNNGGFTAPIVLQLRVGLITEREEAPVPMDQASNESQISAFIDPFDRPDAQAGNPNVRRPSLIWTLWTSTRTGNTDIFVQTLAPMFSPRAGSR